LGWYRIWSDEWIEQGECGVLASGRNGNVFYRIFVKIFATANITIVAGINHLNSDTGAYYVRITSLYSSSVHYYIFFNNSVTLNLPAINYVASGY
jgi:hypothetical protein